MKVVILRYNAGNVLSVDNALRRLGIEAVLSDSVEELRSADRVIIPGVGEARSAMNYLNSRGLDRLIKELTQPVLGICLGMQLFCSWSEENDTECLGIFSEKVRRFQGALKVPHMGWNTLSNLKSPLLKGVSEQSYAYFVHSYRADVGPETIITCDYAGEFSAALAKDNFQAVQFHPEKSCEVGARILENFLNEN